MTKVIDRKTLGEIFEPLVKSAAAELYAPHQVTATLNRKDVERTMRDLAFQVYDQLVETSENNEANA